MKDQFLLAHSVAPRMFTLAGLRPISIRDQMLRGEWLVARLCAEGMIGSEQALLVVGAGAGGVTAALSACERGVSATLVERSKAGPFSTQLASKRFIDPAMYDWPASHWQDAAWPLRGRKSPLLWRAGVASAVAGFWEASFEAKLEALGGGPGDRLHFAKGIDVKRRHLRDDDREVRFNWRDPEQPEGDSSYGAAIICTGFPKETTSVPDAYRGFEFWAPDPYGLGDLGLEPPAKAKALVSGAGDGALQDFLRLVMKPGTDASSVLTHVAVGNAELLASPGLLQAEDEASRVRQWVRPTCNMLSGWHDPYARVAREIWESGESVREMLRDLLWRDRSGKPRHDVVLAHSCSHFGECYPINRLATLLMAQAYAAAQKRRDTSDVLWANYRLQRVTPLDGHQCSDPALREPDAQHHGDALACHGRRHHAVLSLHTCQTQGEMAPSSIDMRELERNVIIIRHGLEPSEPEFGVPRFPRQLLPYDIPSH